MINLEKFFNDNNLDYKDKNILVAASGGPDSMALVDLIRKLNPRKLVIAHLDHQLRADSYLESEVLTAYCQKYKLPFFETKWDKKDHPSTGIEEKARKVRYSFLKKVASQEQIDYVLTAHHGDDLFETILLKLTRSGDPREMSSLKPVRLWENFLLVRPLLTYSKEQLLEYDKKEKLEFINDQTNAEDNIIRNRLRHHVVPKLKNENKLLLKNGNRFLKEMATLMKERELLFRKIKYEIFLGTLRIKEEELAGFDESLRLDYFSYLIKKHFGKQVSFSERNSAQTKNGYSYTAYRGYYYLYKEDKFVKKKMSRAKVLINTPFKWQNNMYMIANQELKDKNLEKIGVFFTAADSNFSIGELMPGMRLNLANGQKVKPKKKFAENSIPSFLRPFCLVIFANNQIKYIQNVYQNQNYDKSYKKYYVYSLKNKLIN
ncbi:tRNA lysidine(34) synthetase TilS [Lactobacillus sp. PV012]|uniref:tRNA lysidine(34) synthetase TilS n=1 Tax=Lactobacillus sp. PV012 TaxID=2594494 RepID=UPI002240833F|nr:tRNA lysidine(34) synthetase TilS [Lactobacillus sp. PV012]QNQ81800.1 tRNA lysidine(34) synthetase TilS [Lactobacillus sp. PV012]